MIANLLILFEAPALGLQLLIDGILIGAVFALAAYGMALVWGVTNIVNVGARSQGPRVCRCGLCAVGRPPRQGRPRQGAPCRPRHGALVSRGVVGEPEQKDVMPGLDPGIHAIT